MALNNIKFTAVDANARIKETQQEISLSELLVENHDWLPHDHNVEGRLTWTVKHVPRPMLLHISRLLCQQFVSTPSALQPLSALDHHSHTIVSCINHTAAATCNEPQLVLNNTYYYE